MAYKSTLTSLVAHTVKCLPTMRETRVRSLGRENPLKKEMATHSITLAWKFPWMEEPGRLQSTGLQRVGHDWVTSLHLILNQQAKWHTQRGHDSLFKGFVNKISHSLCTNKQYRYLLENYLAYFQYASIKRKVERAENTSPNWVYDQHPDLISAGNPVSQLIWSPNWERVPGSTSAPLVRLHRLQFRGSHL